MVALKRADWDDEASLPGLGLLANARAAAHYVRTDPFPTEGPPRFVRQEAPRHKLSDDVIFAHVMHQSGVPTMEEAVKRAKKRKRNRKR